MEDISAALERLAALKDKGILTQEEFDEQKAHLLHPPAPPPVDPAPVPAPTPAPYVAPATGTNNTMLYVVGGLVLLVAALGVLWATGALKSLGLNPPGSSSDTSMAFNSSSVSNMMTTTAPAPAPTIPAIAAPTPAPTYATTDPSNPLIGAWDGNSSNKSSCPTRLMFASTYLMFVASENGTPQTKEVNVTYAVESPTSVTVTPQSDGGHPGTAVITGSQMVLDDCGFTRSGG